jgi:hypothetical protein
LDKSIKKKMLLVHYQDNVLEDWNAWVTRANQDGFDGFDGFVKPGTIWSDEPLDVIAGKVDTPRFVEQKPLTPFGQQMMEAQDALVIAALDSAIETV